jgi:hypothetical protein
VVPFGNLCVGKQSVVTAQEAGPETGTDTIRWIVLTGGVGGVLPVALRNLLVNTLPSRSGATNVLGFVLKILRLAVALDNAIRGMSLLIVNHTGTYLSYLLMTNLA